MAIPNSFVGARMEVSVKCHRSPEGISNLPGVGWRGCRLRMSKDSFPGGGDE